MFTNSSQSITSKNSLGNLKNCAVINGEQWASTKDKKEHGMTLSLFVTSVAVLWSSAIPTGYNIGVLNPSQAILEQFCNQTIFNSYGAILTTPSIALIWSLVVSIFLIGMMVGSLVAGCLCNKFGRKGAIIHVNWLGMISAVLFSTCKVAQSIEMLLVARLLVGVFSGFSMSALPLYLGEISPRRLKGAFGVLQLLGMNFGLVISLTLGLDRILGTEWGWPYLLGLYGIWVAIFTLVLVFCPESPKYLFVNKNNSEASIKELCRLRNAKPEELEDEILEMKQEILQELSGTKWSFAKVVTSSKTRYILALICVLHVGQQFSGINAVFYYSTGIFSSAGMSADESQFASIGAGFANFLMAALSTWLVGRFRRRVLFCSSVAGTSICLVGLTISFYFMDTSSFAPYLAVVFLLLFVLSFGFGLGPIPFFIGNELFDSGPRPIAMSIGCTCNSIANFLVGISFPILQAAIGEFSFLIFVGLSIVVFVITFCCLPETKDKDNNNDRPATLIISMQDSRVMIHNTDEVLGPINEAQGDSDTTLIGNC